MSGAARAVAIDASPVAPMNVLGELVLVRIAAENGATRGDLLRDLAPLTAHRLSPSECRSGIDDALATLAASGCLEDARGRYRLSEAGSAVIASRFGGRAMPAGWAQIRDARLVALVLGLPAEPMMIKALERPDGLRALILQKHFNVGGKRVLGSSRLRMALAVVALERAFGNKIKGGLDAGRGLSVKASRLLAGQLARRPRDFGTDTRLITALAAEAVGATQTDPNALRHALLRAYVSERLGVVLAPTSIAPRATGAQQRRPGDIVFEVLDSDLPELGALESEALASVGADRPAAASRPDLEGFAAAVLAAADSQAEGWPGNRKAFIARVWRAIAAAHPEWGLSDIEFKSMLAEAHRTGHVVLGSADIKSKQNLSDLQDSAIAYKNTVWHFIRVEN